jgi:hypothetical protein
MQQQPIEVTVIDEIFINQESLKINYLPKAYGTHIVCGLPFAVGASSPHFSPNGHQTSTLGGKTNDYAKLNPQHIVPTFGLSRFWLICASSPAPGEKLRLG